MIDTFPIWLTIRVVFSDEDGVKTFKLWNYVIAVISLEKSEAAIQSAII